MLKYSRKIIRFVHHSVFITFTKLLTLSLCFHIISFLSASRFRFYVVWVSGFLFVDDFRMDVLCGYAQLLSLARPTIHTLSLSAALHVFLCLSASPICSVSIFQSSNGFTRNGFKVRTYHIYLIKIDQNDSIAGAHFLRFAFSARHSSDSKAKRRNESHEKLSFEQKNMNLSQQLNLKLYWFIRFIFGPSMNNAHFLTMDNLITMLPKRNSIRDYEKKEKNNQKNYSNSSYW